MSLAAPALRRPDARTLVIALALLLGLQPVATDLYLPALPQIPASLGVAAGAVQWTLSVVVLAFGAGQMFWGPVSDRIGRRPVLLAGLSLFVLASVLAVVAPTLGVLITSRVLQGLGLAASVVCARAIIRDLFEPAEGARVLSKGLSGLGVIALVGPLLGGMAAQWLGWRWALAIVGLFGLACLIYVAWRLPETLPVARRQADMSLGVRLRQWLRITRHPMFRAWTALTTSTYAGLYVFLASSSFVFIEVLGTSRTTYGGIMASMSLCYLVGTVVCRRWLPVKGLPGTVRIGARFTLGGAAWCSALSLLNLATGTLPPVWLMLPGVWLFAVGHGLHQPCSQAGVVAAFPAEAGAASALSGLLMSVMAFGIGMLLVAGLNHPGLRAGIHLMTAGMALGGLVTGLVALGRVQRDGHPPGLPVGDPA